MSNGNDYTPDWYEEGLFDEMEGTIADAFELPSESGGGELDWENLTDRDMAVIMQDPKLQLEYMMKIMDKGGYFGEEEGGLGEALTYEFKTRRGQYQTKSVDWTFEDLMGAIGGEDIANLSEDELLNKLSKNLLERYPDIEGARGGAKVSEFSDTFKSFLADLKEGMKGFAGEGVGVSGEQGLDAQLQALLSDIQDPGGKLSTISDKFSEIGGKKTDIESLLSKIGDKEGGIEDFLSQIGVKKSDIADYKDKITQGGYDIQGLLSDIGVKESDISSALSNITETQKYIGEEKAKGRTFDKAFKQQLSNLMKGYVPAEKRSRYSSIGGGGGAGGGDPTQTYLSNIAGTRGTYSDSIANMMSNIGKYRSLIGTEGGQTGYYGDIGNTYSQIYGTGEIGDTSGAGGGLYGDIANISSQIGTQGGTSGYYGDIGNIYSQIYGTTAYDPTTGIGDTSGAGGGLYGDISGLYSQIYGTGDVGDTSGIGGGLYGDIAGIRSDIGVPGGTTGLYGDIGSEYEDIRGILEDPAAAQGYSISDIYRDWASASKAVPFDFLPSEEGGAGFGADFWGT